ncbi:MAG TPA: hypothetical protein PLX69_23620 [Leptospiraceae bacterium]|nr:hypothetical protein [Leptospiraceae bacterium]
MIDTYLYKKFYYQFDNNLFNSLCRYNDFFNNFIESSKEYGVYPKEKQEGFYITPFTILEAIGCIPKDPKIKFKRKSDLVESIRDFSFNTKTAFESMGELKIQNLINFAERNRPNGADLLPIQFDLYEKCIMNPLNKLGFYDTLVTYLTSDYIYKFKYENNIFKEIFSILERHLFLNNEVYGISKFKLIGNTFDKKRNKIKKEIQGSKIAIENSLMGLTLKRTDFLDCDIAHAVCMGHLLKDVNLIPVIGFTQDNKNRILPRISLYKNFIYKVKSEFLNSKNYNKDDFLFDNVSGILCFVDSKGRITKKEDVIDIPMTGFEPHDLKITNEYKKIETLGFESYSMLLKSNSREL